MLHYVLCKPVIYEIPIRVMTKFGSLQFVGSHNAF